MPNINSASGEASPKTGNVIPFDRANQVATRNMPQIRDHRAPAGVFDRFMIKVLEPVSERELSDVARNRDERNARARDWGRATAVTEYYRAKMTFAHSAAIYSRDVLGDRTAYQRCEKERIEAVSRWRAALSKQLITPARTTADIAWKRRHANKYGLCVSLAEIEAAIAADEAFLAAHPIKRSRGEII